eukprot:234352-Prymnesium_polylepis.1
MHILAMPSSRAFSFTAGRVASGGCNTSAHEAASSASALWRVHNATWADLERAREACECSGERHKAVTEGEECAGQQRCAGRAPVTAARVGVEEGDEGAVRRGVRAVSVAPRAEARGAGRVHGNRSKLKSTWHTCTRVRVRGYHVERLSWA